MFLAYFRSNGTNIDNVAKILQGLNSTTFNFLEQNKALAKVEERIIEYTYKQFTLLDGKSFFSTCVRHNRPCILREMAKKWNMTDENFDLLDVIGGDQRLFYHHTS